MKLDESARALIGAGADATLVTLNPDGSPQVSVVWVAVRSTPDGDELVTAHLHDYRKTRNIRRDGRVAVTILAPPIAGVPTPYLSITGTAAVIEGGAPELSVELAEAMLGSSEHFPPPDAPPGFVTRIRIEKVGGSLIKPPVAWGSLDRV
ncbi:PPOX class F420-dependent oxidoreductase [Mycolicibacterium sp.]|uniref:PPOX class F420-dependent oxidoreductase n=1 Tax=Mycolicibacterium sp. TaxID=2320850 RepID=UPI003D09B563